MWAVGPWSAETKEKEMSRQSYIHPWEGVACRFLAFACFLVAVFRTRVASEQHISSEWEGMAEETGKERKKKATTNNSRLIDRKRIG